MDSTVMDSTDIKITSSTMQNNHALEKILAINNRLINEIQLLHKKIDNMESKMKGYVKILTEDEMEYILLHNKHPNTIYDITKHNMEKLCIEIMLDVNNTIYRDQIFMYLTNKFQCVEISVLNTRDTIALYSKAYVNVIECLNNQCIVLHIARCNIKEHLPHMKNFKIPTYIINKYK